MPLALGSNDVSVRLGGVTPVAVYLGQAQVWPSAIGRTLYFYGSVDSNWGNLGNWYEDAVAAVPASSLPTPADSVIAAADIMSRSPSSSNALIANFTMLDPSNDGYQLDISLNVTGIAIFQGSSVLSTDIDGNTVFNNSSTNSNTGTVYGNATFNDGSFNLGVIEGNATFNDFSSHLGVVNGDATLNDSSTNNGLVTGTITDNR
jgi:hypothetical protein